MMRKRALTGLDLPSILCGSRVQRVANGLTRDSIDFSSALVLRDKRLLPLLGCSQCGINNASATFFLWPLIRDSGTKF